MISKEERHVFESDYKKVGSIDSPKNGHWQVNIFNGAVKEEFKTESEAINFAKRKIEIFQKGKEVPIAVTLHKDKTKPTTLLFPNSKTKEPFEVSDFYWNQIQINVDQQKSALRFDQFSPIRVTFNDIARASAYTSLKKVKGMFYFLISMAAIMVAYFAIMMTFMYAPSTSTIVLSKAVDMPYQSISVAIISGLCICISIFSMVVFLMPFFKYKKNANDDTSGYSYKGKSWKKNYLARVFANWYSFALSIVSIILLVIANALISETVFFNSNIHSARTWTLIFGLVAWDMASIFVFGVFCGQLASTNNKKITFIGTHVPPEDRDLFRSWVTHKRIESKIYHYDYLEHFTFPPTLERLRIISEEIYPEKLKLSEKRASEKFRDLNARYSIGLKKFAQYNSDNRKKDGI